MSDGSNVVKQQVAYQSESLGLSTRTQQTMVLLLRYYVTVGFTNACARFSQLEQRPNM